MNWQPIETAPKDKAVLIANEEGMVTIAWYRNNGPGAAKWMAWRGTVYPSHWMPLPEPPHD